MRRSKLTPEGRALVAAVGRASVPPVARRTDIDLDARKKPARLPIGLAWKKRFYVSKNATERSIAFRRSLPIHAYVGPNGGGKSLCAVRDTLPAIHKGKPVLSTVPIHCFCGDPSHVSIPFVSGEQLLDARDCEIVMDEMVGIVSSRDSMSLDPKIANMLVQLRRRNVVVRWTAPNFARSDKIVREVTFAITECRGYYSDRAAARVDEYGDATLWAPKRLFAFRTYDTAEFEEWTAGKRDKAETENVEWYYAPDDNARDCYDTLGAVESVAGMARGGECPNCGGRRSAPRCKCEPDELTEELEALTIAPARRPRGRRALPVAFDSGPGEEVHEHG